MKAIILAVLMLVLGTSRLAFADELVKRVNDWLIMKIDKTEDYPRYCYMISMPYKTKAYYGGAVRSPRFMVTYLGKDEYTVSTVSDDNIDNKNVVVTIDGVSRELKSDPNNYNSYTYSSVQDIALINDLIRASSYFTVRNYDKPDTYALDYYSLRGFGKAIRLMSNSCKYQ